jgi:hypothetical protein
MQWIAPRHHRGKVFLSGDYAGIQARIVLALSCQHDKAELMASGKDVYCDMASQIYRRTIRLSSVPPRGAPITQDPGRRARAALQPARNVRSQPHRRAELSPRFTKRFACITPANHIALKTAKLARALQKLAPSQPKNRV